MKQAIAASHEAKTHPPEDGDGTDVLAILDKHQEEGHGLIAILGEIQRRYGYLPEKALRTVGERTGRSLVDIYGIATFYGSFSLQPRGKHLISACLGTACHVRGAPRIVEELERQLKIKTGETTPDKQFTLQTVNCLGACALGPVVVIDGRYFPKVRKSKVKQLLDDALAGFDRTDAAEDNRLFPLSVSCSRCNHSLMDTSFDIDGHPSIRVRVSFDCTHGWLRLSSLYGSSSFFAECDVSENTVTRFFCPHCHAELVARSDCPMCDAPMVQMIVRGGGMLQICPRRGCQNRMLDLL
ncbi:MAG TPA: NAD(P)H-dependent oxidoreductase subunit E [Thermoguttaceae bacterium]|nr:NAD(P)H-dependent oxidoreductase subunit E [Thermoguttaceae bacterium]